MAQIHVLKTVRILVYRSTLVRYSHHLIKYTVLQLIKDIKTIGNNYKLDYDYKKKRHYLERLYDLHMNVSIVYIYIRYSIEAIVNKSCRSLSRLLCEYNRCSIVN